jgi:hypothetical protein
MPERFRGMQASATSHIPEKRHLLSRKAHGVIDYLVGFGLIASPRLWHFGDQNVMPGAAMLMGAMIVFYSVITDYELGLLKMIPFAGHLFFDLLIGIGLLCSPWIFQIKGNVADLFFVAGAIQAAMVFLTRRPRDEATT